MTGINKLKLLILTLRSKTLTASLVPVLAATALAHSHLKLAGAPLNWNYFFYALASALCIQIATNLLNDLVDFKTGADSEERKGPKRALQLGLISSSQIKWASAFFLLMALLFGIPLVIRGGVFICALGLVSLLLAYAYTGKPFQLAYRGFGDLFVILFFGLAAVLGMTYLYTLQVNWESVVAGLQIGLLATVLIAINSARDVDEDRLANKKTLAVRFGVDFVKKEITVLIFTALALGVFWVSRGYYLAGLLPIVVMPTALQLIKSIFKEKSGEIYNQFLAQAAFLHLLFGIQLSLGFVLR